MKNRNLLIGLALAALYVWWWRKKRDDAMVATARSLAGISILQ